MPDQNALQAETFAERRRLAEMLAGLSEQQWGTPSLCAGWRVREVIAHVTMPYRLSGPDQFHAGLAAHDFNFDKYADHEARETTAHLTDAELLAVYTDNIEHPWLPPGGGPAGALSHDVIHGLDITEPLDLPAAPASRIATVLAHAGGDNLKYFGVDLTGVSLVAVDAEVTLGEGTPVRATAKDILLHVTGRRPLPER